MEEKRESKDATRIWRVWQTARQMCADRVWSSHYGNQKICANHRFQGYEFRAEDLSIAFDDFKAKYAGPNGEIEYVNRKSLGS
jgi:hypothetical protein